MEINEVQQGTRVTYAIGETEYDAVALGSITTGINKAINAPGFFLTLRYLNEQGTPITIFGAPLLGRDADIKVARHRLDTDPRAQDASEDEKDDLFEAHLNEIKANPRTTGWHLREADAAKRADPKAVQPAPDHEIAQVPREVPNAVLGMPVPQEPAGNTLYERLKANQMAESMSDAGDPLKADPDAANETQPVFETKEYADGSSATGVGPLPDHSPAEQDLIDAAEQSKAELAAAEDGNTTADQSAEQKDTAEPTA